MGLADGYVVRWKVCERFVERLHVFTLACVRLQN
jgi:hypothetical protein